MNLLDLTLRTPAENLACDEALLDAAEAGEIGEVLRFWESTDPFVVLGYSCPIDREVNLDACANHQTPVLRRCSGGGTVVQGPGCLNYALVLRITAGTPFEHLTTTNTHIMQRHADALSRLLHNKVEVAGITDLAINNLKFSGNAQRRKRNYLLFHGTLLYNFKLPLLGQLLHPPVRQPDYRASRPHESFVMNLPTTAGALKAIIRTCWKPDGLLSHIPLEQIHALAVNRYTRPEWTCKF